MQVKPTPQITPVTTNQPTVEKNREAAPIQPEARKEGASQVSDPRAVERVNATSETSNRIDDRSREDVAEQQRLEAKIATRELARADAERKAEKARAEDAIQRRAEGREKVAKSQNQFDQLRVRSDAIVQNRELVVETKRDVKVSNEDSLTRPNSARLQVERALEAQTSTKQEDVAPNPNAVALEAQRKEQAVENQAEKSAVVKRESSAQEVEPRREQPVAEGQRPEVKVEADVQQTNDRIKPVESAQQQDTVTEQRRNSATNILNEVS